MGGLTEEIRLPETGAVVRLTPEHKRIISLIEEGARVVDLGCGEGDNAGDFTSFASTHG